MVRAIQVEGNRRVEVDAVKAAVGTKVGQPLEPRSGSRPTSGPS